ncbi:hypothetical protein HCJ57_05825 [Listeria booriae]|uniref:Uncharacterized protein n=1 Tax=Listeria booriae TaxID=1552123 RepID=A0A099WDR7_9LIST|nr:hypothetical protein [Listeria booriae]KGL43152.1 hypothetical protein EP57_03345 [Listeria booriae]MBC1358003.1 hypothetical protein [Listeria booriae]MBC1899141.1 hypothetical protein [Listeria booriae]MBC1912373.1 hypothetical protein [Listeria booriae]MBC1976681.1 hypothetical protein [Listeria booriae]
MKKKIALLLMAIMVVVSPISAGLTDVSSVQAEAAVKNPVKVALSTTTPVQYSTVKMNVSGVPKNTPYTAVLHYKTTKTTIYGKVGTPHDIKISSATIGYKVRVEVTVKYNRQTYKQNAYFTPRAATKPVAKPVAAKNPVKATLSTTAPKQRSIVTLNVSGVPKNTAYTGTIHYKSKNTKISGKVGTPNKFNISTAAKGYKVKVEVVVKYNKQTYKQYVYFTPR